MPHKKKKLFTKDNSTKFLLLHGNSEAVNADGKKLESILVPVSKNYKPGRTLLFSNIAPLSGSESKDNATEDADLEKLLDLFDEDSDIHEDDKRETLASKMERLNIGSQQKKFKAYHDLNEGEENMDAFFDIHSDQFSDASDEFDSTLPEYSLTSTKVNCDENIKIFNERFEKLMLEEYEDGQIGALDYEEICGHLSTESERVKGLINETLNKEEEEIVLGNYDEVIKEKILCYVEETGEEKYVEVVTEKPLEYDCESILSTYSNIYYHPTVIKEESSKIRKIKIPENPLKRRLTKSDLKQLSDDHESDEESDDGMSVATSINIRLKGETPEQKRERKNLFKEAKRESRKLKKENKLAFRKEDRLQKAQVINAHRNQGIKLI